MFHRNFNTLQLKSLQINYEKPVTFFDNFGEVQNGYIHGAHIIAGQFCYEVSESKRPKSEFNFNGRGKWYAVKPEQIIL